MTSGIQDRGQDFERLQKSVLETSHAILNRQREFDRQLRRAKAELEAIASQQQESLALLNATLEASPDGIVALDRQGRILTYNRRFLEIFGLSDEMMATRDMAQIRAQCARLLGSDSVFDAHLQDASQIEPSRLVEEIRFPDGRSFQQHLTHQSKLGAFDGTVIHWRDISGRVHRKNQRNRLFRTLNRSINEIYFFDAETLKFEYVNAGALANLGYDMETLLGMTPLDIKPDYGEQHFRDMLQPLLTGAAEQVEFETVHRRADGTLYTVQVHLQLDREEERALFMALILDITARKQAEQLIWTQAHFDALTQLPNRMLLLDRLGQELLKVSRHKGHVAVLFIDLDKFKDVNDTLGHDKGDELLIAAAARIKGCLRACDTVARMGGDEFVVLLTELSDTHLAGQVASHILLALAEPFDLSDAQVNVSGSIGIAIGLIDGTSADTLLKCADQAMYESKGLGRNRMTYFTPELEQATVRRSAIVGELRHAIRDGQFALHFQPIVNLRDHSITKAEVLLRWRHPVLGAVSPAEFIPMAEEAGLIGEIGNWVVGDALRWLRAWQDKASSPMCLSVNKSPLEFLHGNAQQCDWAQRVRQAGLPSGSLTLEITEGVLARSMGEIQHSLQSYRAAGVSIAIDDFGTGYSSLAYLSRFQVDFLKIDQSFIQKIPGSSHDLALVQAIVAMAHALGIQVVAEGVETQAQLRALIQAGCDYGQGYLFSRPVDALGFEQLLRDGPLAVHTLPDAH